VRIFNDQYAFATDKDRMHLMGAALQSAMMEQEPEMVKKMSSATGDELRQTVQEALANLRKDKMNDEQRAALTDWIAQEERSMLISRMRAEDMLYLSAPLSSSEKWSPLDGAISGGPVPRGPARSSRSSAILRMTTPTISTPTWPPIACGLIRRCPTKWPRWITKPSSTVSIRS